MKNVFKTARTRLIEERKQRKWSQQELADHIGTTQNNVSRWELGITNPSPYFRTKLCNLFEASANDLGLFPVAATNENVPLSQLQEGRGPQEARPAEEAALEAAVPETPCLWLVPYRRNPWFTGQETVLARLAHLLPDPAEPLALCGMGGIGKTQLALEYAYRHAMEYSAVFWIEAETAESITSSLLRVAEALHLPERDQKDQQRVIAAVQHWLNAHCQWLLIWDNVEDLALFDRFLPATLAGTVLLTTRCQVLGTLAHSIDLLPMKQEEGLLFLLRRARVLEADARAEQVRQFAANRPSQYTAAADLVTLMGGLPLAIDQVGAYIEETQCSPLAYLELFRARGATLLQQRGEGSREHPEPVATTFALAITATEQRHPAAQDLLRVCALLQPDSIPEELFRHGAMHLGPALSAACGDELEWDRVVAAACAYSLLQRQEAEQALSLHRLVQAVMLAAMTNEEQEQWNTRVIAALDVTLPEVRHTTEYAIWKQWARLLPHVLLCLHRVGRASESLSLASLAHKTARYLRRRGRHVEAEPLLQCALSIREQVLGPEHPEVAASLNDLAILSLDQGKHTEAEALFQRALQIWEQALGPEHPNVAISLNDLAVLFRGQGKYAEAEVLHLRALQIREQVLGPEHPYVAVSLSNLAGLYWEQGKYAEAESLLRRALQIWEQALGPEHPNVAEPLSILANIFREQGKYTEAESLYQHALQIWEQTMGPEHPRVAIFLTRLAECFHLQNRDVEAEPILRRALQIWEQALGPENPNVADPLNGLANLSRDRSQYAEAERFYQRALLLREQHLGRQHPDTAQTLHDLAVLRQKQGHLSAAIPLAQRALSIRLQVLGATHPQTIATQILYSQLIQE